MSTRNGRRDDNQLTESVKELTGSVKEASKSFRYIALAVLLHSGSQSMPQLKPAAEKLLGWIAEAGTAIAKGVTK